MPSELLTNPTASFIAAALLTAAALFLLNLLGVLSLVYGCGAALVVALLVRFSTAYAGAYLAHAAGECSAGSILVGAASGRVPAAALAALGLCAAVWSGSFLGGHLRTRTRYPLVARVLCAGALAACIGVGELGTTPPAELLSNYWRLQGLGAGEAAALLRDTPQAWHEIFYPSPLLTSAWILLHQRCFTAFVVAAHAFSGLLALLFLVALCMGPRLCCRRKAHTD